MLHADMNSNARRPSRVPRGRAELAPLRFPDADPV